MTDIEKLKKQLEEVKNTLSQVHKGDDAVIFSEYEPALELCDTLLKYVPEFREYKDFLIIGNNGKESPYFHFGNFGNFLVDRIEKNSKNDPVVERSFEFINAAYNDTDDRHIHTMIGTEVFENLTVSEKTTSIAQEYLKDQALAQFKKAMRE